MNKSNVGVQLYPIVLAGGGFMFLYLNANVQGALCIVLSLLMWMVIFSESYKDN